MASSTHSAVLNKIEVTKWVQGAARKMATAGSEASTTWNESWLEVYRDLGGRARTTGKKGCPMAAAYGLWYLGILVGVARTRRVWSVKRVNHELGKNAAYAIIAAELLANGSAPVVSSLWPVVRERFEELTGDEAAISEQGEINPVIGLFRERQLVVSQQRLS